VATDTGRCPPLCILPAPLRSPQAPNTGGDRRIAFGFADLGITCLAPEPLVDAVLSHLKPGVAEGRYSVYP
jgi:hypothetical protein